jgi:hypothetical protein
LTSIRILAFIALQRNSEKPDANSDHEDKDDHREKNPREFPNFVAFCGLALHRLFNETTDYRPQWPGKQRKREERCLFLSGNLAAPKSRLPLLWLLWRSRFMRK